jgi:endonuclease III
MIENPSPYMLLQEILWPNRWQSTVACVLLNRTKRAQVDKVWPALFQKAPDAQSLLDMPEYQLLEMMKPLGLSKVRSSRLKKLAKDWVEGVDYEKLHGVGEYALASDKIFYRGEIPQKVEDHALSAYLNWIKHERQNSL